MQSKPVPAYRHRLERCMKCIYNPAGTGSLPAMPMRLALSLDPPLCSPRLLLAAANTGSALGEPVVATVRLRAVGCRGNWSCGMRPCATSTSPASIGTAGAERLGASSSRQREPPGDRCSDAVMPDCPSCRTGCTCCWTRFAASSPGRGACRHNPNGLSGHGCSSCQDGG